MPADEVAKATLASNSATPSAAPGKTASSSAPGAAGPANAVTVYFARGPVIAEVEPNDTGPGPENHAPL